MADFGNGPYAWFRPADANGKGVGGNIADAVAGFYLGGVKLPESLESAFAAWVIEFERGYDRPDFPWSSWNARGIALAREVKTIFGDRYAVEYHYAFEEPNRESLPELVRIEMSPKCE